VETSALAATQIPFADDDTVNVHLAETCLAVYGLFSGTPAVYPKIDELRRIMGNSKFEADVMVTTATWLNTTYSDSYVAIDGYNLEQRDRSTGRGG